MRKWTLLLVLALVGSVNAHAVEFEEYRFEALRNDCRSAVKLKSDDMYATFWCQAFVLGMASQIKNEGKCSMPANFLFMQDPMLFGPFSDVVKLIAEADLYDHPKEARLAVYRILNAYLKCST